jgi:dihydropteroate synthase
VANPSSGNLSCGEFNPDRVLNCADKLLDLNTPQVMGILNVTPDSFSDGGQFESVSHALAHAAMMAEAGAAVIDVGGESTRPGAEPVTEQEEIDRVVPVIEQLSSSLSVPVSVDTSKAHVMQAAVAAGAGLINDVRALRESGALDAALAAGVPVCLMHMQGKPRSMQTAPGYSDVANEVRAFLGARTEACMDAGIAREKIILDPGFGFGKTLDHNLMLMKKLDRLVQSGFPVLVGVSRKSMFEQLLGLPVDQRLPPGLALATLAVWKGALLIRTHDVAETVQAVRACHAVMTVH